MRDEITQPLSDADQAALLAAADVLDRLEAGENRCLIFCQDGQYYTDLPDVAAKLREWASVRAGKPE